VPISCPRDALRWVKGYFKRWGIEDTIRFWKQRFGLEDIRTTDIGNFKKLLWIAVVALAFMTVELLTDLMGWANYSISMPLFHERSHMMNDIDRWMQIW